MLLKSDIQVGLWDNAHQVAAQLANLGADLLIETLLKLERQKIEPVPQDNSQATYAPLIQKSDYELDWTRPAIALHNQVRGFYPNCMTTFRGNPLKVLETIPLGNAYWPELTPELQTLVGKIELDSSTEQPGEVVSTLKNVGRLYNQEKDCCCYARYS